MSDWRDTQARIDDLEDRLRLLSLELGGVRDRVTVLESPAAPAATAVREPAAAPLARPAAPTSPRRPAVPAARPPARRPPAPSASAPSPAVPTAPSAPPRPATPPLHETALALARKWDLLGARGFAVAGGAVTALGIILLFVLAANRGWVGPAERVALGAAASAVVLGAGIAWYVRYGQYAAALAAVGAGIVGAYATLAAATALYDLVPDELALPLAAVVAAVATALSLWWSSEILAGIGLVGSALAPALESLDGGTTPASAAFAVIVLGATAAVAVPRRWQALLAVVTAVVGAQVVALLFRPGATGDAATIGVAAALAVLVLAAAASLQVALELAGPPEQRGEVRRLPLSLLLSDVGFTLLAAAILFEAGAHRGVALASVAGVWAAAWLLLRRRSPELGLVLGVAALALAGVATADLLSQDALTLAWSAQAALLVVLASRLRDARLALLGYAYLALAAGHALVFAAPLDVLFSRGAADVRASVAPAAAAIAAAIAGWCVVSEYRVSAEHGPLAWIAGVRTTLAAVAAPLREVLYLAGGALGTYAVAVLLVGISFEWGHVAASGVAAAAGAVCVAVGARRRSSWLAAAGFSALVLVLGEALGFDVPELTARDDRSLGGWSLLEAAAGLLAGGIALRVLHPTRRALGVVSGVAASVALLAALGGAALVVPVDASGGLDRLLLGAAYVVIAVPYAAGAAATFGSGRLRNLSTTLWVLGLLAVLAAEVAFAGDPTWVAAAFAFTAVVVSSLGRATGELRLWIGGWVLVVATTVAALMLHTVPTELGVDQPARLAFAPASLAIACVLVAALVWGRRELRDLSTVAWLLGLTALLEAEGILIGDLRASVLVFALTGGAVALLARPLREERLWWAGAVVVAGSAAWTMAFVTVPEHFLTATPGPADGLWVLAGCMVGLVTVLATAPRHASAIAAVAAAVGVYGVSLAVLELAVRLSPASLQTDFERGHTAVSAVWALLGLTLLAVGLVRGSTWLRIGGLVLFGVSLAKIFVYDLSELNSVARAFSFIVVGGLLLTAGFVTQRLSERIGPSRRDASA